MFTIGSVERRQREKDEMRDEILKAAREIVLSEGMDEISVRKIAGMIEYSPAILYHYFKNKEEIIEKLIEQDYMKIVSALSVLQSSEIAPEDKLKDSARNFITLAFEMGDTYKSMMLNNSPSVLARTSVLYRGAAAERTAISMLCVTLRELPNFKEKDDAQVELTAQVIWSTAFGLSLRMIVEQTNKLQRQRLTDCAADLILCALINS